MDYESYDAVGLAKLVDEGEVTAAELMEEAITRAERLNPKIDAIVRPLFDRGRTLAEAPHPGPFSGVPFLLKDLMQTIAGIPTVGGSRFFQGHIPTEDSTLFRRYEEAGLIVFGKTNTPEFGLLPVTEPAIGAATRNPWDLSRTCGGSSGGAASAVAAGIVPMAHGGDGGGSIRIPAACAGLFGLKPTRARTPSGPRTENWSGFALEHVISRSVRDSAAALDAVVGIEEHAAYHPPYQESSFLSEVGKDPGELRIAYTTDPPLPADVHPDCVEAVEKTAELLRKLGHRVEEIRPEWDARTIARHFVIVVGANTAAEIRESEERLEKKAERDDFETNTWLSALLGEAFSASELVYARRALQAEVRRFTERTRRWDMLLTPTLGQPPLKIGAMQPPLLERKAQELIVRTRASKLIRTDAIMEQTIDRVFQFVAFTPYANFSGQPSMSVPLHWNREGLPIGSMLTAKFGREDQLFRLAAQLEQAQPWKDRRPKL